MADNDTAPNSQRVGQRLYDPTVPPHVILPWEAPEPGQEFRVCRTCRRSKSLAAFQRNGERNGKIIFVPDCKRCVSRRLHEKRYDQETQRVRCSTQDDEVVGRSARAHQHMHVSHPSSVTSSDISPDETPTADPIELPRHITLPFFFQVGDVVINAASVAYFDLTLPNEVEVVMVMQEVDPKQGFVRPVRFSIRDTAEGQEARQLRQILPLLVRGSEAGVLEENRLLRSQLADAQAAYANLEEQLHDLTSKMSAIVAPFQQSHVSGALAGGDNNGSGR